MPTVRPMVPADVDDYLDHHDVLASTNGDGGRFFSPYSRHDTVDRAVSRPRELTRWQTPLTEPGWRRAWGLVVDGAVVGHLYLAGGGLDSELHRASLGMGIQAPHRGQGGGTELLRQALDWARDQPGIDWIDLGVFDGNPARRLYARLGFVEQGRVPDRFRVDGARIDDISMSVSLSALRGGSCSS